MKVEKIQYEKFKEYQDNILELLVDTYVINFGLSQEQSMDISKEKIGLLKEYIKQNNAMLVGAFEGKNLIAFLWLYKHNFFNQDRLHVNQIVVSKKFRRKGIGKRLMKEAENQARCYRVRTIDLFVSENNLKALNMYDELGFKTERRYLKKKI